MAGLLMLASVGVVGVALANGMRAMWQAVLMGGEADE